MVTVKVISVAFALGFFPVFCLGPLRKRGMQSAIFVLVSVMFVAALYCLLAGIFLLLGPSEFVDPANIPKAYEQIQRGDYIVGIVRFLIYALVVASAFWSYYCFKIIHLLRKAKG